MLMIPDPIEYAGKVHAELVRLSSKDLNQQNKRSRLSVDSDHRITPINLAIR